MKNYICIIHNVCVYIYIHTYTHIYVCVKSMTKCHSLFYKWDVILFFFLHKFLNIYKILNNI